MIPNLIVEIPIVDDNGRMTDQMRFFVNGVVNQSLIIGTGSPEGVVAATRGREYMDETGASGAIKYIKRDNSISGDETKGWILI